MAIKHGLAHGPLLGKNIVLGVSGGIAAYKSVELCRRLIDLGASVSPVITQSALKFVGLATFRALSSNEPLVDLFEATDPIPHTSLGQNADLVIVAPATANIIAKFANGLADDALSTTLIASAAPVIFCAAMHTEMWNHPAVVDNVARVRSRGFSVLDPEAGILAGGDHGFGRLAETQAIISAVLEILHVPVSKGPLDGYSVLVTAGGTREAIDPVRYIANRSSGKQGIAVAKVASQLGATGVLVTTVAAPEIAGFEIVMVDSALEMHSEVLSRITAVDALVMCAAVGDFRVSNSSLEKLKKDQGVPEIKLIENPDILFEATLKARSESKNIVVVGFAAETGDALANGYSKLKRKGVDLLVVNDVTEVGAGFGTDTNSVWIVGTNGFEERIILRPKVEIAGVLWKEVANRLGTLRASE